MQGALGLGIPALRGVLAGVEIALDAETIALQSEQAAHGDTGADVMRGEGGDVEEVDAPAGFAV